MRVRDQEPSFTGFATGGKKGLWFSRTRQSDLCLVFTKSAIDALSYAALHPFPIARYGSTAGKMNPTQPELIKAAILRMSEGAEIVAATDNADAGHEIAGHIEEIARICGRTVRRHQPEIPGADLNEIIQQWDQLNCPTPTS